MRIDDNCLFEGACRLREVSEFLQAETNIVKVEGELEIGRFDGLFVLPDGLSELQVVHEEVAFQMVEVPTIFKLLHFFLLLQHLFHHFQSFRELVVAFLYPQVEKYGKGRFFGVFF